jgi:predicted SAM-dependent methyltransferase
MRSQRVKDLYFTIIRLITELNYCRHRLLYPIKLKTKDSGPTWLNIGSGAYYLDGFINIEGNLFHKKDIWLDLRNGIPFPNNSVDAIYACHILEHFYISELLGILSEFLRVLKPGSGLRILVPSLEVAIKAYMNKEIHRFPDFPAPYTSPGGKFFNFIFCDSQHRSTFDFSFMEEILQKIGFSKIVKGTLGCSDIFPQDTLDKIEDIRAEYIQTSLIVEAKK